MRFRVRREVDRFKSHQPIIFLGVIIHEKSAVSGVSSSVNRDAVEDSRVTPYACRKDLLSPGPARARPDTVDAYVIAQSGNAESAYLR
jgi:hypothetical protein